MRCGGHQGHICVDWRLPAVQTLDPLSPAELLWKHPLPHPLLSGLRPPSLHLQARRSRGRHLWAPARGLGVLFREHWGRREAASSLWAAICGSFHLHLQLHTGFLTWLIVTSAGSQLISPLIRCRWGLGRPQPGVGMVLPGPLTWGVRALQTSGPRHPGAHLAHRPSPHLPPSSSWACPSLHSLLVLPFPMEVPALLSVSRVPHSSLWLVSFCQAAVHTLIHALHSYTCSHPPSQAHTRSHTPRNTYTPAHTLSQGSHAHTCAHIPICPDTHSCTFSLTHPYTHIHTRLRFAPRTSLLRALLCPGHGLPWVGSLVVAYKWISWGWSTHCSYWEKENWGRKRGSALQSNLDVRLTSAWIPATPLCGCVDGGICLVSLSLNLFIWKMGIMFSVLQSCAQTKTWIWKI